MKLVFLTCIAEITNHYENIEYTTYLSETFYGPDYKIVPNGFIGLS